MLDNTQWEFFECQQCGRCCTEIGLPYEPQRIDEIARFLGLSTDKVIEKYYGQFNKDHTTWVSEYKKRTPCPFIMTISDKKVCAIYPVRPNTCRQYPLENKLGTEGIDCYGAKIALKKQAQRES